MIIDNQHRRQLLEDCGDISMRRAQSLHPLQAVRLGVLLKSQFHQLVSNLGLSRQSAMRITMMMMMTKSHILHKGLQSSIDEIPSEQCTRSLR